MSRSNVPNGQVRTGAPQQWQAAPEHDPAVQQAYAAAQAALRPQAARAPQQGFGHVQGQQPYGAAGQGYGQPAPQHPAIDQGHYAQPYGAPQAAAQPSYQPVFDRYQPQPEPGPRSYDPRAAAHATHQQQGTPRTHAPAPQAYPPAPAPQPSLYESHAQLRGSFDQWPQSQQPHQPQAAYQPPARHANDFSNYMPGGTPTHDYGQTAPAVQSELQAQLQSIRHATAPYDAQGGQERQWQLAEGAGRRDEYAAAGHAPQQHGYDPHTGYPPEQGGQLQNAVDPGYDQDDVPDYEEDEPRRSRRGLVMVSALVGAIALGGGLAYAYKAFVKPPNRGTQVAKVSAPKEPSKLQPTDPGGRQFPNQDSKLQNRLGDGSAPAAESDGGVKRVQTVVVGRDGAMSPPAAVPGMVVVQPQQSAPAPMPAVPVAAPQEPVPQARVASIQPQPRVPLVNATPPAPAEPAAAAPPVPKKPAAKKVAAPRDDLAAAAAPVTAAPAPAAAAPARGGTGGYVAVLASKGSKAEAERTNADLEQKYDVLKGKIFDVQEANLSSQGKGIYYRSVVGPPGSREFASGVCSQLKAAGYAGCWITAY